MLKLSTVMFIIATLHFSVAFYRSWLAFGGEIAEATSPDVFLVALRPWHRILQDLLFATQECLGAGAAVRYMSLNKEILL